MERYIEVSPGLEEAALKVRQHYSEYEPEEYYFRTYQFLVNRIKINLELCEPTLRFHGIFSISEQKLILAIIQANRPIKTETKKSN